MRDDKLEGAVDSALVRFAKGRASWMKVIVILVIVFGAGVIAAGYM